MFTHAEQFGIIACTTQSETSLYGSSRRLLRMYVYAVLCTRTVHVHLCSADDKGGNEKKWEKETRRKNEIQVEAMGSILSLGWSYHI